MADHPYLEGKWWACEFPERKPELERTCYLNGCDPCEFAKQIHLATYVAHTRPL